MLPGIHQVKSTLIITGSIVLAVADCRASGVNVFAMLSLYAVHRERLFCFILRHTDPVLYKSPSKKTRCKVNLYHGRGKYLL